MVSAVLCDDNTSSSSHMDWVKGGGQDEKINSHVAHQLVLGGTNGDNKVLYLPVVLAFRWYLFFWVHI